MKYRIVADSSADIRTLQDVEFASVPLKITIGAKTFVDDDTLDLDDLRTTLRNHKGSTSTACPSPGEWYDAFGDADRVICVTITSTLSGSYNAAAIAARDYEADHPGRKVFVLDTLSVSAHAALVIEKIRQLILDGCELEQMIEEAKTYLAKSRLTFILQSIRNLANNGRVSPAVAALVGLLGIRIVGRASVRGDLEPNAKCRGDRKALSALVNYMQELGYAGGAVRLHHCDNEEYVASISRLLHDKFPAATISSQPAGGLCSYYAEDGGILVGFEVE